MTADGEWFRRRRLAGRLGPVGVTRLMAFQVIQVGLFVVLVQGVWAAVLGSLVGILAIVVIFGRWNGRWATETLLLWLRLRRRRGRAATGAADPRLAALGELVPDLAVENVPGPDSSQLGMGSDGAGWFGVLEVQPGESGVDPPVPLAALSRIAADAGLAGVVVQVVLYAAPVPNGEAGRQRTMWVAVRLDADQLAGSVTGSVTDPEAQLDVPAVLSELIRRVRRALKRRGLTTRVLDADGLVDALVLSCDLVPPEAAGPGHPGAAARIREDWHGWHSYRLAHRCYWLRSWPDPDRGTDLLATLAELPQTRVSVALLLEPRPELSETDLRCLVRLAGPAPASRQIGEYAEGLAEQLGGRLFPLDGEHAPAVYGSAPSGGGAR